MTVTAAPLVKPTNIGMESASTAGNSLKAAINVTLQLATDAATATFSRIPFASNVNLPFPTAIHVLRAQSALHVNQTLSLMNSKLLACLVKTLCIPSAQAAQTPLRPALPAAGTSLPKIALV